MSQHQAPLNAKQQLMDWLDLMCSEPMTQRDPRWRNEPNPFAMAHVHKRPKAGKPVDPLLKDDLKGLNTLINQVTEVCNKLSAKLPQRQQDGTTAPQQR